MILHILPTWHADYVRLITMDAALPVWLAEAERGTVIKREHIFAAISHPSLRSRYEDIVYHTETLESQLAPM
jgi:hypothetical protein